MNEEFYYKIISDIDFSNNITTEIDKVRDDLSPILSGTFMESSIERLKTDHQLVSNFNNLEIKANNLNVLDKNSINKIRTYLDFLPNSPKNLKNKIEFAKAISNHNTGEQEIIELLDNIIDGKLIINFSDDSIDLIKEKFNNIIDSQMRTGATGVDVAWYFVLTEWINQTYIQTKLKICENDPNCKFSWNKQTRRYECTCS